MDTKTLRQRKRQKKAKASSGNGNQEVLVLPPDLLKKLGISIGSINNENQGIPIDTNFIQNDETINKDTSSEQELTDSSILETATLMKKSVFLSPTFVSTAANNINPGEIEITTRNEDEDLLPDLSYPIGKQDETMVIPLDSDTDGVGNVNQLELCAGVKINGVFSSVSNYDQDLPQEIYLNGGDVNADTISFEDFIKVNGSNGTLDGLISPKNDSGTLSEITDAQNVGGKINIISEETILPSKVKKPKKSAKIKSLTPISINTNIATKVNDAKVDIVPINNKSDPKMTLGLVETVTNSNHTITSENDIRANIKKHILKKSATGKLHDPMINLVDSEMNSSKDLNTINYTENNNFEVKGKNNAGKETNSIAVSYNECNGRNKESKINSQLNEGLESETNSMKGQDDKNASDSMEVKNNFNDHLVSSQLEISKIDNFQVDSVQNPNNSQKDNVEESEDMELEYDVVVNQIYTHTDSKDKSEDHNDLINSVQSQTDNQNYDTDVSNNDASSENADSTTLKSDKKDSNESKVIFSIESTNKKLIEKLVETKMGQNDDLMNATKEITNNNTKNADPSKVKEIADYLKKNAHIYTDRNKLKKEAINLKTKTNKSKLCIQGVEKPGGKDIDREYAGEMKVAKTYARCNHQKLQKISTAIMPKSDNNMSDSINDTINYSTSLKQEFCLCSDFGSLTFYDQDSAYEHIHFWQNNAANCELDVIFSIYNDEATPNNSKSTSDVEEIKTESNVETRNICWNEIKIDTENTNKQSCVAVEVVPKTVNKPESKNNSKRMQLDDNAATISSNANSVILEKNKNTSKSSDKNNLNLVSETVAVKNKGVSNQDTKTTLPKESTESLGTNIEQALIETKESSEKGLLSTKENTVEDDGNELVTVIIEIPDEETCVESSATPKKNATKRRLSENSTAHRKSVEEPLVKKHIKCGVCKRLFSAVDWEQHVTEDHDDIAWKAGESFDIDNPHFTDKLNDRLKYVGVLKCSMCKKEIKRLKRFLGHIKECIKEFVGSKATSSRKQRASVEHVTCGVCQKVMESSTWYKHIGREHGYLAWTSDQLPLDTENETIVGHHLQNIIRATDGLICYKCGLSRKRVKLYLSHVKTCDGTGVSVDETSTTINDPDTTVEEETKTEIVKCGVCKQEVASSEWINHIAKEHKYLAWQDGETPLDLDNEEEVWNHLQQIIRDNNGLVCHKCGLNRKRVKLYLTHVDTCDGTAPLDDSLVMTSDFTTRNTIVECAVCKQKMPNSDWLKHIGKEHNYLAWQEGDTPLVLDNEEMVRSHLHNILRHSDGFTCNKCGLHRKRVHLYLSHIKTCDGNQQSRSDFSTEPFVDLSDDTKILKCGVCKQDVPVIEWIKHIEKEHSYLAWEDGKTPVNLDDETAVRSHLFSISKFNGGLICNKCKKTIKYLKTYLQHIQECGNVCVKVTEVPIEIGKDISLNISNIKTETVKCGACEKSIEKDEWYGHIEKDHEYMAWIDGCPPLDVNDKEMVKDHLQEVSRILGGLKCRSCGLRRKYVKTYLQHIETCNANTFGVTPDLMTRDEVECAICNEKMPPKTWKDHAMTKHYNVAWVAGDVPIDINNPYAVEPFLKQYLIKHGKLVCMECGIRRVSLVGFYAHIIVCGKTEEETEIYKSVCDICHRKYLRIYKSQHMTAHRESEYALERRLQAAKEKELMEEEEQNEVIIEGGKRKAAEKAKTVIEKYKKSLEDGSYRCPTCGFTSSSENETKINNHVCTEGMWGDASDSDKSVKLDSSSEESEDDGDIDSNISEEEQAFEEEETHNSSKNNTKFSDGGTVSTNKINRIPYSVTDVGSYMKKAMDEYIDKYLTSDVLFKHWRSCEVEPVPDSEISTYMPPIEESCKLKINNIDWLTCNRFQSKKDNDVLIFFLGASIQCMSWCPLNVDKKQQNEANYLAVGAHLSTDLPRYGLDDLPSTQGLIQIWNLGNVISEMPEFVFGLAHDFGTVWSMDWCPSGVRDPTNFTPESGNMHRLGLLAVACSNGSAFIFAVPYPESLPKREKPFYKIKPVAELRLTTGTDRKRYQATAVKWSMQDGHSLVVVGYADGTTAYYDLNGESPLLKTTENNLSVFYPHHDERVHNFCIEDMDMYPSGGVSGAQSGGIVCTGGAGGAVAGPLSSNTAASRVIFSPQWPAVLLAGDDGLVNMSVNELEWYSSTRRLGGMRVATGCQWCGRVATAALPLIRLIRTHPSYPELHKQVVGAIQMTPLAGKRKLQTNELAMVVEPLTYDEAIIKYGIEFKQVFAKDKVTQRKYSAMPREAYVERFPLSDVTTMKFCPTYQNHHKLAIALHAGIILIANV